MKYIIKKGTPLFKALGAVNEKMKKADRAAMALARKWKGVNYSKKAGVLAGGISAIKLPEGMQVSGMYRVKSEDGHWFAQKRGKAHKHAWDMINELPTVKCDDLNQLVNFPNMHFTVLQESLVHVRCPQVYFGSSYHLIAIPESLNEYHPVPGMTEILGSEYLKLKAKLGKK